MMINIPVICRPGDPTLKDSGLASEQTRLFGVSCASILAAEPRLRVGKAGEKNGSGGAFALEPAKPVRRTVSPASPALERVSAAIFLARDTPDKRACEQTNSRPARAVLKTVGRK